MLVKEKQRLLNVADEMARSLEALSLRVANLILDQPAIELLGYLWAQLHMAVFTEMMAAKDKEEIRPDKELLQKFQFALEYLHGVWASFEHAARLGKIENNPAKGVRLLAGTPRDRRLSRAELTQLGVATRRHWTGWGRVVEVTDMAWVGESMRMFAPFFHHPIRVLPNDAFATAVKWIVETEVKGP